MIIIIDGSCIAQIFPSRKLNVLAHTIHGNIHTDINIIYPCQTLDPHTKHLIHTPNTWPTHQTLDPHTKHLIHTPNTWSTHQTLGPHIQTLDPHTKHLIHTPNTWSTHQTLDPHIQTVGNRSPRSLQPVGERPLDPSNNEKRKSKMSETEQLTWLSFRQNSAEELMLS